MLEQVRKICSKVLMSGAVAAILTSLVITTPVMADNYPDRPIDLVVGFGTGGGTDRMSRALSTFLSEELGVPVRVTNRPGAGTQISANYVLSRPDDGYTVYASAFMPYLINTILVGDADYSIDDFSVINFQWFNVDLIAANHESVHKSLPDLLDAIRDNPGQVRAAVVQGSAGHLMVRLMLEEAGIPQSNLNVVTYNSGGEARSAVAGGQVDFIAISAQGSEGIREFLTPLAVVNDERVEAWDAPAINDALEPLGIEVPILQGSTHGISVSSEFERQYPERYRILVEALQNTLARKDVQEHLASNDIGGVWVGPERANELMKSNFEFFDKYKNYFN